MVFTASCCSFANVAVPGGVWPLTVVNRMLGSCHECSDTCTPLVPGLPAVETVVDELVPPAQLAAASTTSSEMPAAHLVGHLLIRHPDTVAL